MATQKSIQNRKSRRRPVSSPDTLTWVSRGLAGALAFLSIIGFLGLISLDGVVSGAVGVAFTDLFGRSAWLAPGQWHSRGYWARAPERAFLSPSKGLTWREYR